MRELIPSDQVASSTGIQPDFRRIGVPRFRGSGECYKELVDISSHNRNWRDIVPFIRRVVAIMRLLQVAYWGDARPFSGDCCIASRCKEGVPPWVKEAGCLSP
jgi:hypothetical protein